MNPYENCPVYENENYLLRLVETTDMPDLLKVYSDEKAVPFFNSDNCHGDDFHYTSPERMRQAIEFWLWSYEAKQFVRWAVVDKNIQTAVGTIELFHRSPKTSGKPTDYFHDCGLLRLDLRSDYERQEPIFKILSLIVPPAFSLFDCKMVATKIPPFADKRKKAAEQAGFSKSDEALIGGDDGKIYTDYYVLLK